MRLQLSRLAAILIVTSATIFSASAAELSFTPRFSFGKSGDGPGVFRYPEDFAFSPNGKLHVTDASHAFVQVFEPDTGKFLTRFGGKSDSDAGLVKPEGIAIAPNGDIFIADYDTGFIKRYDAKLEWKQSFSEYGSGAGQNIHAEFMSIHQGRLYMAEAGNHRVNVFDLSGTFLFSFGGPGKEEGKLNNPECAKVNSAGEVYVADLKNDRIQVFDKDGKFLRAFGQPGSGKGEFKTPAGIAFDAHDNVYVSEIGNNRVQVFRPNGSVLAAFGETGEGAGQLRHVHGVAVNPTTGLLYIADSDNHRVQVFAPSDPAALEPQRTN
jgi:DNA-binding beta-propeller fold protein YncE